MTTDLSGRIIRDKLINADYVILRVGRIEPPAAGDAVEYLWQAFTIMQLTHRLWAAPKTTNEVIDLLDSGRIEETDRWTSPICEDYFAHDRIDC